MGLKEELNMFSGTQEYHLWSKLYRRYVLTDGAEYLAKEAKAFWLMDLIASWQTDTKVGKEFFQTWTMKTDLQSGVAVVTCDDGNGRVLAKQTIDFTDFPLEEIKLYAIYDEWFMIILLPSEY